MNPNHVKNRIIIFEDQLFSQIALEHIIFNELKLQSKTTFCNNGIQIIIMIRQLFEEYNENQEALVIIDYHMPGMNGIDVVKQTRDFLTSKGVQPDEMPRFAFRAQQFWDLPPESVREILKHGFKMDDIFEKVTNKQQLKHYFKKIGY